MATDWENHYKATVLDPSRQAGNALPEDLFLRYGISGGHRDPSRFDSRIAETVRYWKKLSINTKVYKPLADVLLAAHDELVREKALTHEEFTRRLADARSRAAKRLSSWIATVAGGIPYVTSAALAHLADLTGGLMTEEEVHTKLTEVGVQLIDPEWDVPAEPPIGNTVALASNLRLLGYRISPQAVFSADQLSGGFRLKDGFRLVGGDGSRLTRAQVEEAKAAVARRTRDSRQTAADNVLTTMLRAADAGALDRLVRWETAQFIRTALANGMPPQVAGDIAAELGLDRSEALELTVTLLSGVAPAAMAPDGAAMVVSALSGNRLREAEALLAGLDEEEAGAEVRSRVQRLASEVAQLVAEADAAERDGQGEAAAERLTKARTLAQDDADLAARLARIPPPPPSGVQTGVDGTRVTVWWTPSPATVGEVTYRVVRNVDREAVGPDDGELVAETGGNHTVDLSPPVAERLTYTIFTLRGATASRGATAPPLRLLPPVGGFELAADGGRVTGSWQLPAAAIDLVVTRTQTGREEPGARIPHAPGAVSSFADEQVRIGAAYDYRVAPVYLSRSGERHEGPGVTGHIVVEHAPAPVTDLTADILPGANGQEVRLRWTPPAGGRVEIRRAGTEPPWAPGDVIPVQAVDGYGEAVGAAATTGPDGRAEAVIPARQGRVVITAVTCGQGRAVIGNAVPLELSAMISGLRVRRQWDTVRVNWIWPDGVHEARVRWSTGTSGGEVSCTRRAVRDDGGVRLEVGPHAVTVAVRSVVRQRHRELLSPPVVREMPARPPRVTWWLGATGWPGFRRRSVLRLRSDQFCEVPQLVLVTGAGGGRDGGELGRLPARRLPANRDTDVDVSDVVPAALADDTTCALADPTDAAVILVRGGRG
jgi:hypothetical protein